MLMHEQAQSLETGLMNTHFASVSESVPESGLGVRVGVRVMVRVMSRLSCEVSRLAARPMLLHQRLLLR